MLGRKKDVLGGYVEIWSGDRRCIRSDFIANIYVILEKKKIFREDIIFTNY